MKKKVILENGTDVWDAKKRYKVNQVVLFNGISYQNTTGANSSPDALFDWALLDVNSSYSITEIKTGANWIDGKPIYRKVLEVTEQSELDSGITIPNIDKPVLIYGTQIDEDGVVYSLNAGEVVNSFAGANVYFSTTIGGTIGQMTSITVIVEYTKTTD